MAGGAPAEWQARSRLSAPKPEITTTRATAPPAHDAPVRFVVAFAKGALAFLSSAFGTKPKTVINESRYTTAAAVVPRMVARGTHNTKLAAIIVVTIHRRVRFRIACARSEELECP